MTVTYQQTEQDTADWYRFYLTRTPEGRRTLLWSRLGGAALAACLVLLMGRVVLRPEGGEWKVVLASALAAGVARYALQVLSLSRDAAEWARRRARTASSRRANGPVSLTASGEGLKFVWSEGESLLHWSALKRVVPTEEHVALYWSDDEVTLVPRRAFPDAAQMEGFAFALEQRRAAAALRGESAPRDAAAGAEAAVASPAASGGAWYRDRQTVDADEATRTRVTR